MAKIITVSGYCISKKKPVGFQFKHEDDGSYVLAGSFVASSTSSMGSASDLTGKFYLSPSFKCKLCGNKAAYVCGNCGALVCWDGTTRTGLVCPGCGMKGDMDPQPSDGPLSVKKDKAQ